MPHTLTPRFFSYRVAALSVIMTLLLFTSAAQAQFLERLSNPSLTVPIKHPPGLGLIIEKVAFGPASGECAEDLVEALISDFVANDVEVVERTNLDHLLDEHDFSWSGHVDRESAVRMGEILGPSAMIFVKVQRCVSETDTFYKMEKVRNSKTDTTHTVKAYFSRTRVFFKGSIRTVDLATGRIFAAKTLEFSPKDVNKSYDGYPEAPAEYELIDQALSSAVSEIHKMYFPWTENASLIFYNDKPCNLKETFRTLKSGQLDLAFSLAQKNLETCQNGSSKVKPKNMAHAIYNVGMMYMIQHNYDTAIRYFREASALRPGSIVDEAINDAEKAKRLSSEMQRVEERAILEIEKQEEQNARRREAEVAETLTNDSVIDMVKMKIPEVIMIKKIKESPCDFNTSPEELGRLSKEGVSENVIILMMEK